MSKARHRGPVHRGIRDLLIGLWLVWAVRRRVTRRTARRVYSAAPAQVNAIALSMADVMRAATTTYPAVEPCPWGLSAGACARFHPVDHVSRYA